MVVSFYTSISRLLAPDMSVLSPQSCSMLSTLFWTHREPILDDSDGTELTQEQDDRSGVLNHNPE